MKTRNRAYRRFQERRIINKRKWLARQWNPRTCLFCEWRSWWREDKREREQAWQEEVNLVAKKLSDTGVPCSCWMCGNKAHMGKPKHSAMRRMLDPIG